MVITNVFIDSDGTVVDTIVMNIDPPHVQRQRALAALENGTHVESAKQTDSDLVGSGAG
jgi:hypothetical protein